MINGTPTIAVLVTGSPISLLSNELAISLKLAYSSQTSFPNLQGVSGTRLNILGKTRNVSLQIENTVFKIDLLVISNIMTTTLLLGLDFIRGSGLILDFTKGKLISDVGPLSQKLVSKIEANGQYTVKPLSTALVYAKVQSNKPKDIHEEFSCTELVLKKRNSFNDVIVYEVTNPTPNTFEIFDSQILGISYEGTKDNTPEIASHPMSSKDRATLVFKHLKINENNQLSAPQKEEVKRLLLNFHDIFAIEERDIGNIKDYTHTIKITNEQELIKFNRTYPVPFKFVEAAKIELKRLERLGVIYKAKTKFSIPSFFIKKGDTGKLRLINDFRHLNSLTSPELACIPSSEVILTSFHENNAKLFCSLDLSDGFYSIPLDRKAQEYCSFTIPNIGSYSYAKLPLCLSNSPSSMSFVVQKALSDVKNCLIYVDDFLIYGKDATEIIETLSEVLKRLKDNGFKINFKKMTFAVSEVKFLGLGVSAQGIKPLHDKVNAIKLLQPPTTRKGCMAVVGSFTYYNRFIDHFSEKIKPLVECIKERKEFGRVCPFKLTNDAKQAFEKLKLCLISAPILRLPSPNKKFFLFTDASQMTVAAVLTQLEDDNYMPISYFSKSLTPGQTNYCAFLRELLAIVQAIKHFKYYLEGGVFEIFTDSQTLTRPKFLTRTQIRCVIFWILEITERFTFTITYIQGKRNNLADALSRIDHNALPPKESSRWTEWFEKEFDSKDEKVVNLINVKDSGTGTEDDPYDHFLDSHGDFLEEQMKDEDITYIRTLLETEGQMSAEDIPSQLSDYRRVWHFLTISKSDLVAIKWYDEMTETFSLKIVVPAKNVDKILFDSHCHETGGHLNYMKTLSKARTVFWWPKMTKLIKLYCNSCEICHKHNISGHPKPVAELKFWDSGNSPGQCIAIDVWESGRHTRSDKYVLVIVDKFSKFVTFTVMQNSRAPTIAKVLVDYFLSNGIPNLILSDLGPNLQGKVMNNLLQLLKISRLRTSPYYPQCNGAAERQFRTMKNILVKFVSENPSDYKELVPFLAYAMNTSIHPATKVSPFVLQRGYEPRHLSSIYWGITSTEYYRNGQHYALEQHKKLRTVYKFALKNIKNMEMSVAETWHHKVKYLKFHEGQDVYYFHKVDNIGHKKIKSPYHLAKIVKVYPADVYLIKLKSSGRQIMSSYNKLTLKPYHVQRDYPSIDARTDEREEWLHLENETVQESEKQYSEESDDTSDDEVVDVANEETTETETVHVPRRSTRDTRGVAPPRYQA